eukprot:gene4732-3417_t
MCTTRSYLSTEYYLVLVTLKNSHATTSTLWNAVKSGACEWGKQHNTKRCTGPDVTVQK